MPRESDNFSQITMEIIQDVLDNKIDFQEDTPFEEMDVDSLDYVNIIVRMEEAFQIEFGLECLSQEFFLTAGDMIQYVRIKVSELQEG